MDLIITCIDCPATANQTFLVSDGHDLSAAELARLIGDALDTPARLLSVPMSWIEMGVKLLGKPKKYRQLCDSLQIDISKMKVFWDDARPISIEEDLKRATREF